MKVYIIETIYGIKHEYINGTCVHVVFPIRA